MGMPVEKKENRTWAIVGTVLAILLCGCPGLTMCLFGPMLPQEKCLTLRVAMDMSQVGLAFPSCAWRSSS